MGTSLQIQFDAFIIKTDEDLTGQEEKIYNYLKSAISRTYKTVRHSLVYTLTNETTYEGSFIDTLDQDEIELNALWMLHEHKRRKISYLEAQERLLGTKDFNNLPDKVKELADLRNGMKDLKEEIKEFEQSFNTYKY